VFPRNITLNGIVLYTFYVSLLALYVSADINREKVMQASKLVSIHAVSPFENLFEVQV
jgi:hypothetical protein